MEDRRAQELVNVQSGSSNSVVVDEGEVVAARRRKSASAMAFEGEKRAHGVKKMGLSTSEMNMVSLTCKRKADQRGNNTKDESSAHLVEEAGENGNVRLNHVSRASGNILQRDVGDC